MSFFLGMRGTNDWTADQRPNSWRDQILYLYPDGDAPLTAMLSKLKSEKTDSPEFYWWTKTLSSVGVDVLGIYTDAVMTVAYAGGGATGNTVYVNLSAADVVRFRPGHQVLFRYSNDSTLDLVGKVTSRNENGANSSVGVMLLEDDDNSTQTNDLSDVDRLLVIGNINSEGAEMPQSIIKDPTKMYNFTQIWRTPLELT